MVTLNFNMKDKFSFTHILHFKIGGYSFFNRNEILYVQLAKFRLYKEIELHKKY